MDAYTHSQVKIFQKYAKEGLTQEEAGKAVAETLELPWVRRTLVFADQAIYLLELNTLKYLFVSDSARNVLGYEPEQFADFSFTTSLMPPEELDVSLRVSESLMTGIADLKLSPSQILRLRATRNNWLRRKDGVVVNILQQMLPLVATPEGMPLLQMSIVTDITAFNSTSEHFYSVFLRDESGEEQMLFSGRGENNSAPISSREREIFKLICQGMSSDAIASQLSVSIETVKTHRKNILEKTHSQNSIDLVRYGYAQGWL